MEPVSCNAIVLRIGELFLKRSNRHIFVRRLVRNLERLLGDLPWRVDSYQGRLMLLPKDGADAEETLDRALERCCMCFGISSVSPVLRLDSPDLEELAQQAAALAEETLPPTARTFAVRARRPNKRFPHRSPDIARTVGDAVGEAIGLAVDLSNPDFEVGVEVGRHAFVYAERRPGPGGLPVGTAGKSMLLLSGGIDSPVAGWLAMKRGCPLEAVHFHSPPYTGPAVQALVEDLARVLADYGGPLVIHRVPMTDLQLQVKERCHQQLTVLLYRRFMVRIACRIAAQRKALALVTGESIGQVASQTIENLGCIEAVSDLPMVRPLVTYDKQETMQLARRIGTYDISIRPHEDSCSLFLPRHPEIYGKVHILERAEARLDLDELLDVAMERVETVIVEAS